MLAWKAAIFYILLGQSLLKSVLSFAFRKNSQKVKIFPEVLTNSKHQSGLKKVKSNKNLKYIYFFFSNTHKDQREKENPLILKDSEYEGKYFALAGVAQWIECWPVNERVIGSIPSQGTGLGCRPGPQLGARKRQLHIDIPLLLFLSPLTSF